MFLDSEKRIGLVELQLWCFQLHFIPIQDPLQKTPWRKKSRGFPLMWQILAWNQMQMVRVFACGNTRELPPAASINTFSLQIHAPSLVLYGKTVKSSFIVTGGLKSAPTRDKETYAGKRCYSDFHWREHQSTAYKKLLSSSMLNDLCMMTSKEGHV